MQKTSFYIINAITVYRLVASFLLLWLIITGRQQVFAWLMALSFFTDAIDGFLARRYKVTSVAGSRIDSIADDLTVLMGIIGVAVFKTAFVKEQLPLIITLFVFYLVQNALALIRYGKLTSFHTYLGKCGAVLQGFFLILIFFLKQPPMVLYYITMFITLLDLFEEIILILMLKDWQADVKGIFWARKKVD